MRCASKLGQALDLAFVFLRDMIESNLRMAWDAVTPTHHMRPGIVAVPLDASTDLEIFLLASMVTLTPGTLSLAVSADRKTLYVHALYIRDPDQVRRELKQRFERRLLRLLR